MLVPSRPTYPNTDLPHSSRVEVMVGNWRSMIMRGDNRLRAEEVRAGEEAQKGLILIRIRGLACQAAANASETRSRSLRSFTLDSLIGHFLGILPDPSGVSPMATPWRSKLCQRPPRVPLFRLWP